MNISVITLHRVTNFGSLLQTYATQTALETLGHNVEILDFVPEGLTFRRAVYPRGGSLVKKLVKLLPLAAVNAVQYRMTDRFLQKHIHLSARRFATYRQLTASHPPADVYLTGSDQVWNTQNSNQKDDIQAYYLCFAPDGAKKIAYAASFGKCDFPPEEEVDIRRWLARYDRIAVREDSGLSVLARMGIENGVHVADPTLLLNADEWRAFCDKPIPSGRYVFIYNLNRSRLVEEIAAGVARERGISVVNFADALEFVPGAKNRLGNTPMDFLRYLAGAELVVTDSFHGTAFSINLGRPFLSVAPPKYALRLESILRQFGVFSRYCADVETGLSAARQEIDVPAVQAALASVRAQSLSYLSDALGKDTT